jgi:hypothetical protein
MLQKKRENQAGNNKEFPIGEKAEQDAAEGERRRVGLKHAFHVPFAIQLFKAAGESRFAFATGPQNAALGRTIDPLIESLRRMFPDPISLNHHALL